MSDSKQTNLTNPDLWIRLIYMIIFGFLSVLARAVVVVIAVLQFLLVLLAREENKNLRDLGDSTAQWTCQTFRFLTFASEQKPFPFQDWPVAQAATGSQWEKDVAEEKPATTDSTEGSVTDKSQAEVSETNDSEIEQEPTKADDGQSKS